MHNLPTKPAETSSAQGQAVNINTTNNSRGRGGGNDNSNNRRGNSTNRGYTFNNNNNRSNSISKLGNSSSRGKANNNNSYNNNNSNRGKNKSRRGREKGNRGGSKRGGYNNKNNNSNRHGKNDESEESSTYSTNKQNNQPLDDSDSEDYGAIHSLPEDGAIHSLPEDFYDYDEHVQRYIWHGPAPVCSSRTAYRSSPFRLDHSFADWQRFDEFFDMPWPPPLPIRYEPCNLDRMTQAFQAVELDIKRWENIFADLWKAHVYDDNERFLILLWAITRLQYLRALYPVMDANKYDFDMRSYYDQAVLIMNIKGPDITAVVDFMSRKREGAQEDSSVYFDKWFQNNTLLGIWHKGPSTSAQKSAIKHNIELPEDTLAHKKAKTDTTSTVVPPPSIPKATQGAATASTTKLASAAANTPSPNSPAPGIAATPSSTLTPRSKEFANSPTSPPNSPQEKATSQAIASNSQSQPKVTPWTTGIPPAPSFMSFTPLPTTTTTTPTRGGGALLPAPTTSPVSSTFAVTLPPASHVTLSQPAAASPPQASLKPISQRASPLTPTTAHSHSVPPPNLTHQLPPKPQITALPITSTTQPTPSKAAPQPTLTTPRKIPTSAQPATNQPTSTPCTSPKTAQLQQPKEPKPVATTTTAMAITAAAAVATAEVNIPSLLQDFKSWMETETKGHQDQSALLQSLLTKNALLESKLEAHTTRWNDEVKKQEAHRSIPIVTHSCEIELASLKERSFAQDLKISQLEANLESRIRHSLEHDLAVVRNDLQEERVDNLTKDLEIKRAEAVEAMAKARAEMQDARQMVAEAREERAIAMERAARAEADNQMLLRVINELQGTGWGVSGQAQAQGLQGQDAGVHHTGLLSSSVHPKPQIDHPHYPFTTAAAGSSTFMRFGTSMRQSYSSSSTESLASAGATGAAATDPPIHRMKVISVKLENDYIARLNAEVPKPDLDPDMTEDDEGRTDTDHDATDEE